MGSAAKAIGVLGPAEGLPPLGAVESGARLGRSGESRCFGGHGCSRADHQVN